jgi:hypothetical protein
MVPGKTYEYLDSGRPIVALLPSGDEAAALIERAGHLRLDPGDGAGLLGALRTRFARWRAEGRLADTRPTWLDERRRDRLAATLAHALEPWSGGGGA